MGKQALTLFSLLLIRMIEDYGQSGDNMADRRQLYVEMSKCSVPQLSLIYAVLMEHKNGKFPSVTFM